MVTWFLFSDTATPTRAKQSQATVYIIAPPPQSPEKDDANFVTIYMTVTLCRDNFNNPFIFPRNEYRLHYAAVSGVSATAVELIL